MNAHPVTSHLSIGPSPDSHADARTDAPAHAHAAGPRLLISRAALLHNVRVLRSRLAPGVGLCAVVKAQAYGHGQDLVVETLSRFAVSPGGPRAADAFAVATLDEAAALNTSLPVLVFRPVEHVLIGRHREQLAEAVRRGWSLNLTTRTAADDLDRLAESLAQSLARRATVHVMVDTGMTRDGCSLADLPGLLEHILSKPALKLASLATHFTDGEEADARYSLEQTARFRAATDAVAKAHNVRRHAANTGGTLNCPAAHFDFVRPGIGLYGIHPAGRPDEATPLRPAMTWLAPLVHIHDVAPGQSAGYNRTWTAARQSRIGVVPVGYADGYDRRLSNAGVVIVRGKPCPVVGRVSMDLITINLTDCPEASITDTVTLLDNDPASPAGVYAMAKACDTIPYEITTRLGQRAPRVAWEPAEA
ncbi:MAG: alanine racemase [Phycisphaerae bacterium]